MSWKRYGTTRSFLSALVLYQIACCVFTIITHAESSLRITGAGSATPTGSSTASGFDTRRDAVFSDVSDTAVISQLTPDLVIRMFPAAPRANIEKYLPLVRRALTERGLVDKAMILMALATMRAECAAFDLTGEVPSPLNTVAPGPPFNKYDWRQDLGNMGPPDGARFRGRGFIQLTGRKNYKFYGDMLGYNLVGNPDLANTPQPAAQILAAYLKQNEPSIRSALATGDLAAARRIVNGGLNGLDGFRAAYMVGDLLIRDHDSDVALSRESQRRRETRKVKEVKAASNSPPTSRNVKLIARKKANVADVKTRARKKDIAAKGKADVKKRDDVADTNVRAKKRDDVADLKSPAKKKDDEPDENNEKAGKKKGKGFFLFRPFRLFRTSSKP
jgi:putative chitinase